MSTQLNNDTVQVINANGKIEGQCSGSSSCSINSYNSLYLKITFITDQSGIGPGGDPANSGFELSYYLSMLRLRHQCYCFSHSFVLGLLLTKVFRDCLFSTFFLQFIQLI